MRVIAGTAKGRTLKTVKTNDIRPTTDRVKEAVFNILGDTVIDARFLDLFAGSGSMGIEALSRGAERAVFIDESSEAIRIIRDNLCHTKLIEQAEVYKNNALRAIPLLGRKRRLFSIIYLDPPYFKGVYKPALELIDRHQLLERNGVVLTESYKQDNLPDLIGNLTKVRQEKYGDTLISFYRYK